MATKRVTQSRKLIETRAIIVAYAMSRLDDGFLATYALKSWRDAFRTLGSKLGVAPASMKNLRDEFDPVHPNSRQGWHKRPMLASRQRVLGEFCDVSDQALFEVVNRILDRDTDVESAICRPLMDETRRTDNVAERLRTGRLAEEFFLGNSKEICGISPSRVVDLRSEAQGYDFGIRDEPRIAIEVKGMKSRKGDVLFTDLEWRQANIRFTNYWLVVVGSLSSKPTARLFKDPVSSVRAVSTIRQSAVISWRAVVDVA